ncbi:hypothetical protein GYMLUDRAFT_242987 [Collybiopsis luxurians FD-317 M1]|uniref:Uncharacterized protein n=1 Tax=Collybiopsis luxurians FD-317 M1 TaxID=944289 RepID=A0A0D0CI32_9AGAR|nr:hypothetical protein GYMLUDRAFT_242987 [Collybiopsis luxurians FD-317 M1]
MAQPQLHSQTLSANPNYSIQWMHHIQSGKILIPSQNGYHHFVSPLGIVAVLECDRLLQRTGATLQNTDIPLVYHHISQKVNHNPHIHLQKLATFDPSTGVINTSSPPVDYRFFYPFMQNADLHAEVFEALGLASLPHNQQIMFMHLMQQNTQINTGTAVAAHTGTCGINRRGGHLRRRDSTWRPNLHAPLSVANPSRAITPTTSTLETLLTATVLPNSTSTSPSIIADLEAFTSAIPSISTMTNEQTNAYLDTFSTNSSNLTTPSPTLPTNDVTMESSA